jgi:beta-glucosidase
MDGLVTGRTIDLNAQEDARQFHWAGVGKLSVEGAPVDLAAGAAAGDDLLLEWRLDALPPSPVRLSLGGAALDFYGAIGDAPRGKVVETRIPLRCFAAAGADLSRVGGPLRIDAGAGFSLTIRNAKIATGGGGGSCPSPSR